MDSRLMLLGLGILYLLVDPGWAYDENEYRRALEVLQQLADEGRKRGAFDCKELSESCDAVIPCCGKTQCYWEDGYSAVQKGRCITCVSKSRKCQRDSQCCAHLQCDKGNAMWVDGTCQKYRREGSCYRDGQCVKDCRKKWYKTHGQCS